MQDDAHVQAPPARGQDPAFVSAMREVMDVAVARHRGQVLVRHYDEFGAGRYGWGSVLQLVDPVGVYVTIWYDAGDQDVIAWGDLPYREWDPERDEASAGACLEGLDQLVEDLVGPRRAQAVAAAGQRHRRAQRSASRWWRWPARRAGLVGAGPQPCPRCASHLTSAVVAPSLATWGAPFRAPVNLDGPAYGCMACGEEWGRWGDEFADGR